MSGYVNEDHGGWTELRVHGVTGTPPADMLQHADVKLVAGDGNAGFYRSRWEDEKVSSDTDENRVEAYWWGGLTAGDGARAFWLLLAPFMLVNLAYWMFPQAKPGARQPLHRIAEAGLRTFALSITATLMLVMVQLSMDLIGWQCIRAATSCTHQLKWLAWLGFLGSPTLDTPARRVVVLAAVPLAVILVLWWLGRKSWLQNEASVVPAAASTVSAASLLPLEDRKMWNGREQVRKLRAMHISAAIAVIALFVAAPVAHTRLAEVAIGLTLAFLAALVVLSGCGPLLDRQRPDGLAPGTGRDGFTVLLWVAPALVVVAGLAAWLARTGDVSTEKSLPGLIGAMVCLLVGQVVLIAVLAVLLLVMHAVRPPAPEVRPAPLPGAKPVTVKPAWFGLSAVVLMTVALAMVDGFGAGLGIRFADLLGTPAVPNDDPTRSIPAILYVVPPGYPWVVSLTVPLAVILLIVGGILGFRLLTTTKKAHLGTAGTVYGAEETAADASRAAAIARTWALAQIGSVAQTLTVITVGLIGLFIAAGVVFFMRDHAWLFQHARWAVNVGTFLGFAYVLGLLWVGRQAFGNSQFRRTVGVLWDIGTFWPRAIHPLAPPCYAERTIPDLMTRVHYLGKPGHVTLSCHSQGTVIGAAVLMQLTYAESRRVAVLTYGSPLSRLYTRFFPGYFSAGALLRMGASLLGSEPGPSAGAGDDVAARKTWPWRNLYRPSDPIGGPVFADYPAGSSASATEDVDRQLIDPAFGRCDGDPCYPPAYGHSNYFEDPAFDQTLAELRRRRGAGPAVTHPERNGAGDSARTAHRSPPVR